MKCQPPRGFAILAAKGRIMELFRLLRPPISSGSTSEGLQTGVSRERGETPARGEVLLRRGFVVDFVVDFVVVSCENGACALDGPADLSLGPLLWGRGVVLALGCSWARPGRTMGGQWAEAGNARGSRGRSRSSRAISIALSPAQEGCPQPSSFLPQRDVGRAGRGGDLLCKRHRGCSSKLLCGKSPFCFVKCSHEKEFWPLGMDLVWTGLGW